MNSLNTQSILEDFEKLYQAPIEKLPKKHPLTNISFDENNAYIDINVAGFDPDNDISIRLESDILIIVGDILDTYETDREYVQKHIRLEPFERKIQIHPDFINGDITAQHKNGILEIVLTKKETSTKKIDITIS